MLRGPDSLVRGTPPMHTHARREAPRAPSFRGVLGLGYSAGYSETDSDKGFHCSRNVEDAPPGTITGQGHNHWFDWCKLSRLGLKGLEARL